MFKAFPNKSLSNEKGEFVGEQMGMDLRDYFAAKAMQAILSQTCTNKKYTVEMTVEDSYKVANAMMEVRNATK
jgi:hypothetical protein